VRIVSDCFLRAQREVADNTAPSLTTIKTSRRVGGRRHVKKLRRFATPITMVA
jgi:hypothetical protein